MDNDNKIVKYKGYIRKCAINILAWLENNPNPTQEKTQELKGYKGQINDHIFNYCENIKDWEKHTTTLPLDQTKLIKQQEFLEETQGVSAEEDVIVGGN